MLMISRTMCLLRRLSHSVSSYQHALRLMLAKSRNPSGGAPWDIMKSKQMDKSITFWLLSTEHTFQFCIPPLKGTPPKGHKYTNPATANYYLAQLAEKKTDEELKQLATRLCEDGVLSKIYGAALKRFGERFAQLSADLSYRQLFFTSVVGLDWVGDELGMPYCALAHSSFTDFVKWMWKEGKNPRFGIRIHAGEGTIRPAAQRATLGGHALLKGAFKLHMYILMESIRKIYGELRDDCKEEYVPLRIGHGVAFLYKPNEHEDPVFAQDMRNFRDFLKANRIVCELNPKSNFMLLSDTFISDNCKHVTDTLAAFTDKEVDLPVVLCTDDDGIWAIHKCPEHHNHISVGYEYCQAIQRKNIRTEKLIDDMAKLALDASFAAPIKENGK